MDTNLDVHVVSVWARGAEDDAGHVRLGKRRLHRVHAAAAAAGRDFEQKSNLLGAAGSPMGGCRCWYALFVCQSAMDERALRIQ